MARYTAYYKEEATAVQCPRCGAQLLQRWPVDVKASRERDVPGLLFETNADTLVCSKCPWTIHLAPRPRTRNVNPEHRWRGEADRHGDKDPAR